MKDKILMPFACILTMPVLTVHSKVCDFVHTVTVTKEGRTLQVSISTPCEHVRGIDGLTLSVRDIVHVRDNPVLARAQESGCSATCLVPCAIMNGCWLAAGMMASSLCKCAGPLTIEFTEP